MTRRVLDWDLEDPSSFVGTNEEILTQVRTLRDKIKVLVEKLIDQYHGDQLTY